MHFVNLTLATLFETKNFLHPVLSFVVVALLIDTKCATSQ